MKDQNKSRLSKRQVHRKMVMRDGKAMIAKAEASNLEFHPKSHYPVHILPLLTITSMSVTAHGKKQITFKNHYSIQKNVVHIRQMSLVKCSIAHTY